MKRTIAIIFVLLATAGLVWWLTSSGDESKTTSQTQQSTSDQTQTAETGEVLSGVVEVQIQDSSFAPAIIRVKKGTTVTWTNQDSVQHNVVSDEDSPREGLNGPLLEKGKTYSFTFDNVGTYAYHCTPHPTMQGTVEVVE